MQIIKHKPDSKIWKEGKRKRERKERKNKNSDPENKKRK